MNRSDALKIIARTARTVQTIIGAMAPPGTEWGMTDYQKEGDSVYTNFGKGLPAIVTIQRNGPGIIESFNTSEEASTAYDARVADPGVAWWIGLYNQSLAINGESARRDETYVGPVHTETDKHVTTTITTKTTKASLLPIGIAAAVGLVAIVISGRKH